MMGCFTQQSPSSVLSPWLLDMGPLDPAVLDSLHINTELPSPVQTSLSSKRAASPQKDGTTRRAAKRSRKSRAKPKAPVTHLSATKLNFKDLVHQLTGNHTPPPLPSPDFCKLAAASAPSDMWSPAESAHAAASHVLLAKLAHSLKLLDTLCGYFLLQGSSPEMQKSNSLPFLQAQGGGSSLKTGSPNVSSSDSSTFSPNKNATTCRELGGASASHMLDHVDLLSKAQELERFLQCRGDVRPQADHPVS